METVILNPDDAAIIIGTEEVKVILPNMKDGVIRDFAGMV